MPRPANPHDALFRTLLDDPCDAGTLIREALPPAVAARLSDRTPRLLDGTFVDDALRESRSDRLYEMDRTDGRPALVHVLLEHKSAPDPGTPLQILGYMVRIWDRWADRDPARLRALPEIIPLVLYHGRAPWTVPLSVFECLDGEPLLDWPPRYVLNDVARREDAALSAVPHVRAVLTALKYGVSGAAPEEVLVRIVRALPDGSLLERRTIHYILSSVPSVGRESWQRIAAAAKPAREEALISIAAREWMAEGRAEGMAEGQAALLLRLLERRFGPLPESVRARVLAAAPADREAWADRLLDAPDLDAVLAVRQS